MAVKIFGKQVSTPMAVAIAGGSGLAIWFAYKQHKASSSTSASAIDPITGLPYSQDQQTDPLTGQTYLAEAQQYGSVQAAENAIAGQSAVDYSSAFGTGAGGVVGSSATPLVPASTVQGTTYASNAAWAQAAEAGLTDIGYASTDVAAALGRYLGSLSLTSDQATIVQAAIAEYGPPPVGTFQVIMAPTTGPTGSGTGGTGTSTPPPSSGGSTPPPSSPPPVPTGPITNQVRELHVSALYTNSAQVEWAPPVAQNGEMPTGYGVAAYDSAGHLVNGPFTVGAGQLYANIGGLKSKTAYHVNVWADPAPPNGPHQTVSFTTK